VSSLAVAWAIVKSYPAAQSGKSATAKTYATRVSHSEKRAHRRRLFEAADHERTHNITGNDSKKSRLNRTDFLNRLKIGLKTITDYKRSKIGLQKNMNYKNDASIV